MKAMDHIHKSMNPRNVKRKKTSLERHLYTPQKQGRINYSKLKSFCTAKESKK